MPCPNGHEVDAQQTFCPACGVRMTQTSITSPPTQRAVRSWHVLGGLALALALVVAAIVAASLRSSDSEQADRRTTSSVDTAPEDPEPEEQCVLVVNYLLQESADAMSQGYFGGISIESAFNQLGIASYDEVRDSRAALGFSNAQEKLGDLVNGGADPFRAIETVQAEVEFYCYDEVGNFDNSPENGFGGLQ